MKHLLLRAPFDVESDRKLQQFKHLRRIRLTQPGPPTAKVACHASVAPGERTQTSSTLALQEEHRNKSSGSRPAHTEEKRTSRKNPNTSSATSPAERRKKAPPNARKYALRYRPLGSPESLAAPLACPLGKAVNVVHVVNIAWHIAEREGGANQRSVSQGRCARLSERGTEISSALPSPSEGKRGILGVGERATITSPQAKAGRTLTSNAT